jgi:predicted transcriptional regulator
MTAKAKEKAKEMALKYWNVARDYNASYTDAMKIGASCAIIECENIIGLLEVPQKGDYFGMIREFYRDIKKELELL